MANFSKFLSLIGGADRTVDLSLNSSVLELGGGGLQMDGSTSGHIVISASATTSTYSIVWPAAQAVSSGYVLSNDGTGVLSWAPGSAGSVTSVALALPVSVFTVSGSPVTSTGTLTGSLNTQTANTVWAGPTTGSAATPTFRSLVAADIPSLSAIYLPLSGGTLTGTLNGTSAIFSSTISASNLSGTNTGDQTISLTGDVVGSGTGSFATTLVATSNSTLTTLSSLSLPGSQVTGNISGNAANVTGTVAIAHGGTGQTSAASAFAALSPLTTAGDIIFENATPAPAILAIGSTGQVLTVVSGLPAWTSPAFSGTVTSVAFADASTTPIYSISGSPVTSSGTLTQTLTTQTAATVFAGPATGSAAQPSFRSLVSTDIPDLSATYVTQSEVGAASGVASLDGSGKIPLAQLPSAVFIYQGTWDPTTNTPTLIDGTGTSGYVYWVSAAFAGPVVGLSNPSMVNFEIGDLVLYNGTQWELTTPAAGVQSVNGSQGVVTVNAINQLTGDVTATAASQSQSKATTVAAIQGTTVSGTTGTGNVVFSASPTVTGTLTAATISASGPVTGSNLSGTNTGDQTITLTGPVTGSGTGSFATTITAGAVGTTQLAAASVTAAKLGAVTDGITTDQSGAGSTIEVLSSPTVKESATAGEAFAATTLWAVRFAKAADSGFVAGRVYKADNDTTSADNFYVIGLAFPGSSVAAAGTITVTKMGLINVPSHGFTPGQPLYLDAAGAVTGTAPSTTLLAVEKVGIVRDANNIEVQIQTMGIN